MTTSRRTAPHLVVAIGGAALVGGGAAVPLPVQAEQRTEGTELEPPDNKLLELRVRRVATPVASDVCGPEHNTRQHDPLQHFDLR
jgi:hypothetical protein